MDPSEIGTLTVRALVDSTSFGTLLIPVWLLLHPDRLRLGRLTLYLGTVAACYFAVGLVLAAGAGALIEQYGQLARSRPVAVAQVVIGVALVALSFLFDSKKAKARSRERAGAGGGGRMGPTAGAPGGVGRPQTPPAPPPGSWGLLASSWA